MVRGRYSVYGQLEVWELDIETLEKGWRILSKTKFDLSTSKKGK